MVIFFKKHGKAAFQIQLKFQALEERSVISVKISGSERKKFSNTDIANYCETSRNQLWSYEEMQHMRVRVNDQNDVWCGMGTGGSGRGDSVKLSRVSGKEFSFLMLLLYF